MFTVADAFNRTIKLYQTMTALRGKGIRGNGGLNKESETASKVPFCDSISSSSCEREEFSEREKISNPLSQSLTTQNKSVLSYSVPKRDPKAPFPKGGLSAAEIIKNPALSRLLVLAARKVKEQREKQK